MAELSDNIISLFRSTEDFVLDEIVKNDYKKYTFKSNRPGFMLPKNPDAYAAFHFGMTQSSFNHGNSSFYVLSQEAAQPLEELARASKGSLAGLKKVLDNSPMYMQQPYTDAIAAHIEEVAHGERLTLNSNLGNIILLTKDKQELRKMIEEEEFKARVIMIYVLNSLGITSYNSQWSNIKRDEEFKWRYENDTLFAAHYNGYVRAERHFRMYGAKSVDMNFMLN